MSSPDTVVPLGVLLALLASTSYGLSDVLSGAVVRRHATAALALWAQLTGLAVLGALAALRQPSVPLGAAGRGALAGVVGALGVLAFYGALQRGRTSVVTPVAGAGVVVPVLAGLVGGDPLGGRVAAGVAAVVVGLLVVAATHGGDEAAVAPALALARPVPGRTQPAPAADGCVPAPAALPHRAALGLAAVAALCFGLFFVVLEEATAQAGAGRDALDVALAVALAVQVGALGPTLLAATRHSRACLRPRRGLLLPAAAVGLLDVAADLLVTLAVDRGPLAVVGPLASLDPVVSVLVATVVLGERQRPLPSLGVAVTLAGTVLTATG